MLDHDLAMALAKDAAVEYHPFLNFGDGDILLLAKSSRITGDRPQHIMFRVHKSMLRSSSPIFENMFEDATSGGDIHRGIPLVQMAGDDADDLACVFTCLYSPTELPFRRLDPNTPILIRPAVQLASKYLMDSLRTRLLKQVEDDWPRSLQEWDHQETEVATVASAIARDGSKRPPGSRCLAECVPEPAAAIVFATEFECKDVLPAASYQLARTSADEDCALLTEDPSNADEARRIWALRLTRLAKWQLLDNATFLRIMRGRERLNDFREEMLSVPMVGSALSANCRPSWSQPNIPPSYWFQGAKSYPCFDFVRRLFHLIWAKNKAANDPLKALKTCIEWRCAPLDILFGLGGLRLCGNCAVALQERMVEMRQELWRRLPEYFDVA